MVVLLAMNRHVIVLATTIPLGRNVYHPHQTGSDIYRYSPRWKLLFAAVAPTLCMQLLAFCVDEKFMLKDLSSCKPSFSLHAVMILWDRLILIDSAQAKQAIKKKTSWRRSFELLLKPVNDSA